MLIEFSVTLDPDTSLEQAQAVREEVLDAIRHRLKLYQKNPIVGSTLTADISDSPQTGNVFTDRATDISELQKQCAESPEGHLLSEDGFGICSKCNLAVTP